MRSDFFHLNERSSIPYKLKKKFCINKSDKMAEKKVQFFQGHIWGGQKLESAPSFRQMTTVPFFKFEKVEF